MNTGKSELATTVAQEIPNGSFWADMKTMIQKYNAACEAGRTLQEFILADWPQRPESVKSVADWNRYTREVNQRWYDAVTTEQGFREAQADFEQWRSRVMRTMPPGVWFQAFDDLWVGRNQIGIVLTVRDSDEQEIPNIWDVRKFSGIEAIISSIFLPNDYIRCVQVLMMHPFGYGMDAIQRSKTDMMECWDDDCSPIEFVQQFMYSKGILNVNHSDRRG